MHTEFQTIEEALANYATFWAAEVARKRMPAVGSDHVFYELVEFLAGDDAALKLQLSYYFHNYEECLTFCKAGSMSLARVQMEFIEQNLLLDMDTLTVKGMEGIYFPMRAYYFHKRKDFKEALLLLEGSIQCFELLNVHGFKKARRAMLEQRLNLCRVYFEMGKVEAALQESQRLLACVVDFLSLKELDASEETRIVNYYFGSLLNAALKQEGGDLSGIYAALMDMILVWEKEAPDLVQPYFGLLRAMRGGGDRIFVKQFSQDILLVFEAPGPVQLMLWAHLFHLALAAGYATRLEFGEAIALYLRNTAKIGIDVFRKVLSAFLWKDSVVR